MATYLIGSETEIKRQEGDTGDIIITMPESLSMTPYTQTKFQVKNLSGTVIINKSVSAGTITVSGQTITIPLLTTDTKGYAGQYRWELEISNSTEVITVAKGVFIIVEEIIT
jgi:hypothetical protein